MQKLLAGEKEKFQRIRQLLSGVDVPATASAQAAKTQTVSPAGRELPRGLTVGNLRNEPLPGGNPRLNGTKKTPY